jgi:hypothetical protein
MAHWPRQLRRTLGFTAALFSLLLVQNAFGIPFRQANANLSPRTLYRRLDSLAGAVFTESTHIVGNLQTLYKLHQLALESSQPETPSVTIFTGSRSRFASRSLVCLFPVVPAPRRTEYRCPLYHRG